MTKNRRFLILYSVLLIVLSISAKMFLDSIHRFPILMYHSVDYTKDKKDRLTISPDIFAKQIKYLHDHKYNVIPLEEAVSYIQQKKKPPARTVAITFDDGYENNYKYVYPVLKQYHIPATIFIITDFVGRKDFMNWDEINEMSASGIIDIESHTKSHPWLTALDDKKLRDEFAGSREILEKKIGKKIKFICYPMGVYDERVKLMAKETGYEAGFATKPTRLSPNYDVYEIKRVRISPAANNLFIYAIKLSGYHAFYKVIHNDYKDMSAIRWKKGS